MHTPLATRHVHLHNTPLLSARHLTVLCLWLLVGPIAHAQVAASSAMSERVGYIEFGGGPSDFSAAPTGVGGYDNDQRATTYHLSIGNYLFSPQWGLEGGYDDFGSVHRAGGTSAADALHLHVIGRVPLSPSWNLLGKVGTVYGRTNVSSVVGSGIAAGSEREFGWSYGVGLEAALAAPWSGVLQYDEHTLTFPGSGEERISTTTLGLRYHF